MSLHSADLSLPQILFQPLVQMLPPFEQHRVTNQLEPRSKLQTLILEHLFQVRWGNVSCVLGLVRVDVDVDTGLDEQDIIDWESLSATGTVWREVEGAGTFVFSPFSIARGFVVYSREELELVQRHLDGLDPQLLV